ncbi:ribbon-helix-helix domain-containing protein [Tolypothrix sp. VBCCA 56010]|uniref:ribbon-helix-helix domain-containing protein n=1 Tax=Tolypothrix sp. VBCCA 56010 TaxID=3137731 RepID=UPI003D7D949D
MSYDGDKVQTLKISMASRRPRVAFVCDDEIKEILEDWALEENRTVSNLIESIVLQAVETTGRGRKEPRSNKKGKK